MDHLTEAWGEEGDEFLNFLGYREHCQYPKATVYNLLDDQRIVASVCFGPDEGLVWVYHVYIRPEFRGQGLLERLIAAVADEAVERGRGVGGDFDDAHLKARFVRAAEMRRGIV